MKRVYRGSRETFYVGFLLISIILLSIFPIWYSMKIDKRTEKIAEKIAVIEEQRLESLESDVISLRELLILQEKQIAILLKKPRRVTTNVILRIEGSKE